MLSRYEGLDQLADVSKEHLQILKTMHAVGLKWAETFLREDTSLIFRLGYHSVCVKSCSKVCCYSSFLFFF